MAARDERTDEELMGAYIDGDKSALRILFDRHSPALLGMLRRSLPAEADARDLLQQTFLQLHRARNDFRRDARLKPWLFTIALNLKREYFRKRARKKETPMDPESYPEPSVEPRVLQGFEHSLQVREAVDALPESMRIVIEMHWFDELPFKEIAEILGLGLSAVKVRAHRGYKKLRESLSELESNL